MSRRRKLGRVTRDRWFESGSLQRRVRVSHRPGRCRSRTAGFARVCAARLAARSAETRRVEQYRTKERQYLCWPLFQYRRAAGTVWVASGRADFGWALSADRAIHPDWAMEAGDRLSQEPEGTDPRARALPVERREGLSVVTRSAPGGPGFAMLRPVNS
jgi:hypothetical protein